jgi:hypothetical protein
MLIKLIMSSHLLLVFCNQNSIHNTFQLSKNINSISLTFNFKINRLFIIEQIEWKGAKKLYSISISIVIVTMTIIMSLFSVVIRNNISKKLKMLE